MARRAAGFAVGVVFGVTLSWTGMSSPEVIREALLFQDAYLYLMFASAVITATVGTRLLRARGVRALLTGEQISLERATAPAAPHLGQPAVRRRLGDLGRLPRADRHPAGPGRRVGALHNGRRGGRHLALPAHPATRRGGEMTRDGRPSAELARLINGYQVSQAIHVAATLGIADLIGDGVRSSDDLATETGSDPGALYRLLRALASLGVLTEQDGRAFELTPVGECLRSDAPEPLGGWAAHVGQPYYFEAWAQLEHTVRTGESALPRPPRAGRVGVPRASTRRWACSSTAP